MPLDITHTRTRTGKQFSTEPDPFYMGMDLNTGYEYLATGLHGIVSESIVALAFADQRIVNVHNFGFTFLLQYSINIYLNGNK
jgi:hypothetical protein